MSTTASRELVLASTSAIRVGSKSFSFASSFFPKRLRIASHLLYAWCRRCDDRIDEAATPGDARSALRELREQTLMAYEGMALDDPAFRAFQAVALDRRIPREYAEELLNGMEMDVEGRPYERLDELELYCFRVASTVGLMMSHAMGLGSRDALPLAVRAGMAMQMTNIARDVADDFRLRRRYVPAAWFEGGRAPDPRRDEFDPAPFVEPIRRLLHLADEHYEAGRSGLRYLPFRAAIAVGAAMEIYRDIGRIVLAKGPRAWDTRAYVSKPRKVWLALIGAARALATVPWRIANPSRQAELSPAYRFEPFGEGRAPLLA